MEADLLVNVWEQRETLMNFFCRENSFFGRKKKELGKETKELFVKSHLDLETSGKYFVEIFVAKI